MKNVLIKLPALLLIACILTLSFAACGKEPSPLDVYEEDTDTEKKDMYYVAMNVRDYGVMIFLLDAQNSPITVENFVKLVREDFYDGLTFHRVLSGFMIQGGDPNADGTGSSPNKIYGEFSENGYENNFIDHRKGVISMARSSSMNSASCQFFICNDTNANVSYSLDGKYASFGWIVYGEEVIDAITNATAPYGDSNGLISNKSKQAVIEEIRVIKYDEDSAEQ